MSVYFEHSEDVLKARSKPSTLVELLRWRGLNQAKRRAYTFFVDGEFEEIHLTHGELDRQARAEEYSRFIAEEVYPETDVARLPEIALGAEHMFEIVELRNDRHDYARTLRAWLKRLRANREAAVNLVGEDIVARYERYLKKAIFSFEIGTLGLLRITFRRIDDPRFDCRHAGGRNE